MSAFFRAFLLVMLAQPIFSSVYYVQSPGSAVHGVTTGTLSDPFTTIQQCVDALHAAGDECRLLGGTYNEPTVIISNLVGTEEKPIVVAAAQGHTVILDGTSPITGQWAPIAGRGKCQHSTYTLKLGQAEAEGVYQLFVGDEMQTPARWPNALWSDGSVFNWTHWASFDNGKPWSPSQYKPGQVLEFFDSGPLAESQLDASGAMMIGNIAHMDTFVGFVEAHKTGANEFTARYTVNAMGNTKSSNSIYFFEGLAEFVDQPSEWAYDHSTNLLVMCTNSTSSRGGSGPPTNLRHKTQTYAMNVTNTSHLTIANLSFFGTTFNAEGGIPYLRLESLELNYPSFSKRMLGSNRAAATTRLLDHAEGAARSSTVRPSPVPEDSSFIVFNCSWYGSDGPLIDYSGTHGNLTNNLFKANDWSGKVLDTARYTYKGL
jgi:hypothetical protein